MRRHQRIAAMQPVADWFGRPLVWGETDCGQMLCALCVAYGLPNPGAALEPYSTEAQAYQRVRSAGHDNLAAWMDAIAAPIAPAMAWPGDVLGYPADDPRWGASLGLMVTDRRALVLHPETGVWDHADPAGAVLAWRLV